MADGVGDIRPPLPAEEGQRGVAQGGKGLGRVAGALLAGVLAHGHVAHVVDAVLNGLIANDKICFVRFARLARERARPSSPRGPRRPPAPGYPSDDGDR
ncbi:MAG TPA: hypothetical protein VFW96_16495, partial [Thermomicrobiales bacterium]|nr:hypothetical protein [Thermomicrobiales bacterium]